MKIIFLHGYGQNTERFNHLNSKLIKGLVKHFGCTYETLEGQYPSTGYRLEDGGRSYWETTDVVTQLIDHHPLDLSALIDQIPPADILCGFSQGSNVILHCLQKDPARCRLAILNNPLKGCVQGPISTPVVFTFGRYDEYIGLPQQEELLAIASRHVVLTHDKGHHIPQTKAFIDQLCQSIATLI